MQFLKDQLQLRLYQQTILSTAVEKNTLVVLPTGLGKTHIAIALAGLYADKGKVLIMAPTVPLVNQHYDNFKKFFSPAEDLAILTGKIAAVDRIKLWNSANIIVATPQTVRFDIISGRISLDSVSLVVFDEAHRAVGDYAYVFVAKACAQAQKPIRVLALTASPGTSDVADEVCKNLFIEKVEARHREHDEVLPYVQQIDTKFALLELPPELQNIKMHLEEAIEARATNLRRLGANLPSRVTRKSLLVLKSELQRQFLSDKRFGLSLSICASLIKLQHAHALLTTESLVALKRYFAEVWSSASKKQTRSLKDLVSDFHVKAAYALTQSALEKGLEHPKLAAAKSAIERLLRDKPSAKILLFTEFRDNVLTIVDTVSSIPSATVHKFIGQASRAEKGMSQKIQVEVLDSFRKGDLNCLVCTSVGEEGIDIPDVDLVIFYSPLPSVIRTVQRRGRTGRTSLGTVLMLVTKGTRDEAYYWAAKHKEAELNATISDMQQDVKQSSLDNFPTKIAEDITIFVDSRESELAELLHNKGVKVKLGALKAGDFILSEDVGCERKAIEDFVSSLLDGRLFDQAKKMRENFTKPFIILEGDFNLLLSIRNVAPQAIFGALASLTLDWSIPILITKSKDETAELLITVAKREQLERKKSISVRGSHKPQTIPELQQYFIEGLPQIGPEAARALLKHFGSPGAVVNATEAELKKVEGIGDKKASLLRTILDTLFKD